MKKSFLFFVLSLSFIISNSLSATTYYVSPTATSSGTGTVANPYNFSTAISKSLTAGDSLILRGGMYSFSTKQSYTKSGSSAKYITIVNYPNEIPVLDFRTETYGSSYPGVSLSGSYVHIKGLTIQGAGDNGMIVSGNYNKIENCTFRWNCDSGLQMKTGSNNLILNCDSYENFDYQTGGISSPDFGGNADGFADKQYTNTGTNTYKGCRSWRNSDDGWDHYQKIGNTVYDSCWCYANGPASYDMKLNIRFKTDSASWFYQFKSTNFVITNYGNGNGFKLGGDYTAHNATLKHCVSVANKVKGFDQNNNAGAMTIYNSTAYYNKPDYGFSNGSYGTLVVKNCASLNSLSSNSFKGKSVTNINNSWSSGFSCVSGDFLSLTQAEMMNARQSDGSLPEISLLHQKATSGMIDKGLDLGMFYSGTAPDLGAFEYLVTTAVESVKENNQTVSVYYNSKSHEISFRGTTAAIECFGLNGIKVFSQKSITENPTIKTENITSGIYLIRVLTQDGKTEVSKLIIN